MIIAAYEKALALDSQQSDALAVKALMTLILEHDWEAAGKLYQRAMVSWENTEAITGYAMFYLAAIDRLPQAIRFYTQAEERDPLHAGYKANLAFFLLYSGDTKAAIPKAREALELRSNHLLALMTLIDAYTSTGRYSAARTVLQNIPPELQKQPTIKARAGLYYAAVAAINSRMSFD